MDKKDDKPEKKKEKQAKEAKEEKINEPQKHSPQKAEILTSRETRDNKY